MNTETHSRQRVHCPYCEHSQVELFRFYDLYYFQPLLILCDSEEGGCDKYYVIKPTLKFSYTAHAIHGE